MLVNSALVYLKCSTVILSSCQSLELSQSLMCVNICRYQGHVGTSLIVGGVDVTGAHLYSIYPHGSYDKLPFLTMGLFRPLL